MSLAVTGAEDLKRHLLELGLKPGDNVLVYSRLISFGELPEGVEGVYRTLRDVLGPQSTIAVPTFRLFTTGEEGYDRKTSPSEGCGVLSEYVRQLPGAVRSRCPMHSHAAIGPKAALLETSDGAVSMGPRSDFEIFHREGFTKLILGSTFPESATFIIHVMALNGAVPYRAWLDLPRPLLDQGKLMPFTCRYYGRIDRAAHGEDWNIARELLRAAGKLRQGKLPYGASYAFQLTDLMDVLAPALKARPDALLAQGAAA
jgi:aminoglycoside N3'-acetyltransferase